MWNLKYSTNEPIYKTDEQTYGYKRGGLWGKDRPGVWAQQTQTTTYRMDKQPGPNVQHRELYLISWDKPQWKRI